MLVAGKGTRRRPPFSYSTPLLVRSVDGFSTGGRRITTGKRRKGLRASAVGTQNVRSGYDESPSDKRRRALVALEAVVVPVTLVERYELRRPQTGDWLETADTLLGKQLREALGAIWLLVT